MRISSVLHPTTLLEWYTVCVDLSMLQLLPSYNLSPLSYLFYPTTCGPPMRHAPSNCCLRRSLLHLHIPLYHGDQYSILFDLHLLWLSYKLILNRLHPLESDLVRNTVRTEKDGRSNTFNVVPRLAYGWTISHNQKKCLLFGSAEGIKNNPLILHAKWLYPGAMYAYSVGGKKTRVCSPGSELKAVK